jgi:hypothetical protein
VVQKVAYKEGQLSYRTFDDSGTEVLRLKYKPARISAGESQLPLLDKQGPSGYTIRQTATGDYIIEVRRERARDVTIEGS